MPNSCRIDPQISYEGRLVLGLLAVDFCYTKAIDDYFKSVDRPLQNKFKKNLTEKSKSANRISAKGCFVFEYFQDSIRKHPERTSNDNIAGNGSF